MNVVVDMFACNDRCDRMALLGAALGAGALELSTLLLEASLDGSRVPVVKFTVLYGHNVVVVLFGKHLTVLDWLDGGMKVILVDFTINGSGGLFMAVLGDGLLCDSGGNLFVDSGVMMSSLVPG